MASNFGGFTPGPWGDDGGGWIVGPNGVRVSEYAGCGTHDAEWPNPADQRLAIAAPELLEVLVKCRRALATVWDEDEKRLHEIDAAIAKATGAQP